MRKGKVLKYIVLLILFGALAETSLSQSGKSIYPLLPQSVYPKIRIQTTPAAGAEPKFNSPSLEWPSRKKATYSIRISASKSFDKMLAEKQGIPYAIFNPHQKLPPGVWYWQYKCNDENWHSADSFVVKETTRVFDTPDVATILNHIPSQHPRVLTNRKELPALRKKGAAQKESALLLQQADGYLGKPVPSEASALPTYKGKDDFENDKIASIASKRAGWDVQKVLMTLSQAYLLTGDPKYFSAARNWMLQVATWNPNGPSHTNNFGDAGIMSGLAIGVDTFWDLLTASEREPIIRQAATRASQFYKLWAGQVESRSSSMHVWQHILHNLLQTAIALKGEIPKTDQWIEYIYELWIAQSPKMGEQDGAWFNGISYFGMNTLSLIDVSTIFTELSGTDFMGSAWYRNNPLWLIYAFPAGSVPDGFCNDGEKYKSPDLLYAGYADGLARLLDLPYARWYAQSVAKNLGQEVAEDEEFRWFRIRYGSRKHQPALPKGFSLPQAARFPDIGVAYMHTTVQNAATDLMLSIRSSPYGPMAHAHADQNNFNIAYGGKRLFYNTGYRPAMGDPHFLGWYKHTRGHNGILVDDQGQPFTDESYGWIPRFLHGRQISYAVADASKAYAGTDEGVKTDHGVKLYRRHFLLLRPSTVVIYDELEADHDATWSWLLHNDSGLTAIPGKQVILAGNEATKAEVTLFASTPINFNVTDQFSVPVDNWTNKTDEEGDTILFKNQWHFKGTSVEKTAKMRYLAIIRVNPGGKFEEISSDIARGAFTAGDWEIAAELDASRAAFLRAKKSDGSAILVSEGDVAVGGKSLRGKNHESSKLFEIIDGKEFFRETMDEFPASIQNKINKH